MNNLVVKELEIVIENISDMIVFYFDGLEKKVDQIEIVKDKLEHKENRLLFSKYLKDEISKKIVVTDTETKKYYNENKSKWSGEFNNVKPNVISELRKKLMYQRRDDLVEKFRKDFNIQYNEVMLNELAEKFTQEKKVSNENKVSN